MSRFRHFAAIDWSGAKGERQRGIAVAQCTGDGPPTLVQRDRPWSRGEVLEWLRNELAPGTLVGMDLGIALPFADCGAYFPGWSDSPANARALWDMVDAICAGDHNLEVGSLVDHPRLSAYFRRHGGREGAAFHHPDATHRRGRFRVTEWAQEQQGCKPYSNFNLVGAAQVGKSSLTGMRVLARLGGSVPVWPIDPVPEGGSVIVEIYTTLAAIAAGRTAARSKMTDCASLNAGLHSLGSAAVARRGPIDDHSADALLTAAWLRTAADRRELWQPQAMSAEIAATEGWTFGVP